MLRILLVENCINLNTVLFDLDGSPYTVKMFLLLLKDRGTTKNEGKRLIKIFGSRFSDREAVLTYLKDVAYSMLNIPLNCEDTAIGQETHH